MKKLKYWLFSLSFTILLLEMSLRIFHKNQTYSEALGRGYQSAYGENSNDYYPAHRPNDTFVLDMYDYKYPYVTNELGIREKTTSVLNDSSAFKIIALGDSYTEGVGASYDSSWPRLLEAQVRSKLPNSMVFDAGVSGSDPFFEYVLFRDKLASFNPSLVIVAVNGTDIDDFWLRGGLERFHANGMVIFRSAPWYEPFYHYSYVLRELLSVFCGINNQLFLNESALTKTGNEFVKETSALFVTFKKNLKKPCNLLIVIHPSPDECANPENTDNSRTLATLADLTDSLQKNGLSAINLFQNLNPVITKDNIASFTYKHDGHYTPAGYKLYAEKLFERINKDYPDFLR